MTQNKSCDSPLVHLHNATPKGRNSQINIYILKLWISQSIYYYYVLPIKNIANIFTSIFIVREIYSISKQLDTCLGCFTRALFLFEQKSISSFFFIRFCFWLVFNFRLYQSKHTPLLNL